MTITHISEREQALERENAKMLQTIRVQAAAIEELRTAHDVALQGWKCECSTDDACRFAKERDAFKSDAARYQWLRMRLEVRKMQAISGSMRDAIDVCVGAAFFDTKFPREKPKPYQVDRADSFDAAIDAAMKETK